MSEKPFPHISCLNSKIPLRFSELVIVPPMIIYEFRVDTDAYQ